MQTPPRSFPGKLLSRLVSSTSNCGFNRINAVVNGNGVLEVDCTVSIDGDHSDWTKWFSFKNGSVTGMRWSPH